MDKKTSLRINNRTETTFGIISVCLAVFSILLFISAVYQAAYMLDGREIVIGFIELFAMIACLVGFLFGIVGETRVDKFKNTAHIGIAMNVLIGIFHIIVLFKGY